jgi:hypothetical protein
MHQLRFGDKPGNSYGSTKDLCTLLWRCGGITVFDRGLKSLTKHAKYGSWRIICLPGRRHRYHFVEMARNCEAHEFCQDARRRIEGAKNAVPGST